MKVENSRKAMSRACTIAHGPEQSRKTAVKIEVGKTGNFPSEINKTYGESLSVIFKVLSEKKMTKSEMNVFVFLAFVILGSSIP